MHTSVSMRARPPATSVPCYFQSSLWVLSPSSTRSHPAQQFRTLPVIIINRFPWESGSAPHQVEGGGTKGAEMAHTWCLWVHVWGWCVVNVFRKHSKQLTVTFNYNQLLTRVFPYEVYHSSWELVGIFWRHFSYFKSVWDLCASKNVNYSGKNCMKLLKMFFLFSFSFYILTRIHQLWGECRGAVLVWSSRKCLCKTSENFP